MKVLILGGTGVMGTSLVKYLADQGVETTVTSRSVKESKKNIKYIQGNARDNEFLRSLLTVHWDAIVDFMAYKTSELKERLDSLLAATSQYVFMSSSRVYANSENPITEDSPRLLDQTTDEEYLLTDEYALAKARQENLLHKTGKKNWTIIRPYITYGNNRLQLGIYEKEQWLYRALRGRTIVFSKDIASKLTTLTYGIDVSKRIGSLIGNEKAFGEIFHITGHKYCFWREIYAIYLDVLEKKLGYRPKILLLNKDEFIQLNGKMVRYKLIYDRFYNRRFNSDKINSIFSEEEFIPIEKGLRASLESFLENPKYLPINWNLQAKMDKKTHENSVKDIKRMVDKIKYLIVRYLK